MKDLKLENGTVVSVADCKHERLQEYFKMFTRLSDLKQVYLFGNALYEDCREECAIGLVFIHTCSKQAFLKDLVLVSHLEGIDMQRDMWLHAGNTPEYSADVATQYVKAGVLIFDYDWYNDLAPIAE